MAAGPPARPGSGVLGRASRNTARARAPRRPRRPPPQAATPPAASAASAGAGGSRRPSSRPRRPTPPQQPPPRLPRSPRPRSSPRRRPQRRSSPPRRQRRPSPPPPRSRTRTGPCRWAGLGLHGLGRPGEQAVPQQQGVPAPAALVLPPPPRLAAPAPPPAWHSHRRPTTQPCRRTAAAASAAGRRLACWALSAGECSRARARQQVVWCRSPLLVPPCDICGIGSRRTPAHAPQLLGSCSQRLLYLAAAAVLNLKVHAVHALFLLHSAHHCSLPILPISAPQLRLRVLLGPPPRPGPQLLL